MGKTKKITEEQFKALTNVQIIELSDTQIMPLGICCKLKHARLCMGLSQRQFADYLGIPYSTYFQYEYDFPVGMSHIQKIVDKVNTIQLTDIISQGKNK